MMNLSNSMTALFALASMALTTTDGIRAVLISANDPIIHGSGYVQGIVKSGEVSIIHWDISKETECKGTNSRVWQGVDGFYLKEALGETRLPYGIDQHYEIDTKIPELAPTGPMSLTIEGEYNCPAMSPVPFELGPVLMIVEE